MEKIRIRQFLLAFCFVLQCILIPVTATQSTEPSTDPSTEPTQTVPVTTAPALPPSAPNPASDSDSGIDAPRALTDPAALELDGEAIFLYELTSDTLLYAKNPDTRREPASMTKVMTALLALEHGVLTDSITVTEADLEDMDPSGSNSGLTAGETFTLEELLYCLLIESANDAAPVIANYIAGSESAFVEMMNQKAAELGCTGTHFSNTHGLHDTEHYSTARDIAKIMRAALEYDVFRTISSTDLYEMPATEGHEARTLITTNYLIGTYYTGIYRDRRVICGKTGFTTPAGRCVVTLAETDDLQYITVVMGASDGEEDGSYLYGSFLSTSRLLNFGSSGFTTVEALSPNLTVDQIPVADTDECVAVAPSGTVRTLLPSDYDPAQLYTLYELSGTLRVPVKAGQVVGTVCRYYGNICVAQADLVTLSNLDPVPTTIHSPIPDSSLPISTAPSGPSVWMIAVGVLLGIAVLLLLALIILILRARAIRRRRRRRRRRMS